MKVLLINGSPHEKGCTYAALSEAADALGECGVETEIFHIGTGPVRGCIACRGCADGGGLCAFSDDPANTIIEKLREADGVIIGSPVYYASANGALTALLDRVFFAAGRFFAKKPGAAVVSARRAGTTAALDRLNKYFTISNMPVVPSQYWNMVHGTSPGDVAKDVEGLQTMRVLARNMAWLLQSVEKAALEPPQPEQRVFTNFVR